MASAKIKEYLDRQGVKYVSISHSPAYTSQEVAASAHIPGKTLAKTVMVIADGKMIMAVLPGTRRVDLDRLKVALQAQQIALAQEAEFKSLFPDCEIGAMPPFGNLYNVPVVADSALTEDTEIVFNAGSHRELIRLAYKDFERLVKPTIAKFA